MPPIVYAIAVIGVLGGLNYMQFKSRAALSEKLTSVQQEADHAKAETSRQIEATRQHARQLARERARAARQTAAVAHSPDDGCADRRMPADFVDALRVQPEGKDGKAAPAGAGRSTPDAAVSR